MEAREETVQLYLTHTGPHFGAWPEESVIRGELVAAGPGVVLPVIRRGGALLATYEESVGHPIAGPVAMRGAQLVFERIATLIEALTHIAAPSERARVVAAIAQALTTALNDGDAHVKFLAGQFSTMQQASPDAVPVLAFEAADHLSEIKVFPNRIEISKWHGATETILMSGIASVSVQRSDGLITALYRKDVVVRTNDGSHHQFVAGDTRRAEQIRDTILRLCG